MKRLLLAGYAALFLATGTAQATERYLIRCRGQLFTVYGHHGYAFYRGNAPDNSGKDLQRLFRFRGDDLLFRGRKCEYVKDLLNAATNP